MSMSPPGYHSYVATCTVLDVGVRVSVNSSLNLWRGIMVNFSTEVAVSHNKVDGSGYHGISIASSKFVTVVDNDASHNSKALAGYARIRISSSDNIVVEHNKADDNGRGIRVTGSTKGSFTDNSAHGNAVFDLDWDSLGPMNFKNNHCETANPSKAAWDAK